MWDRGNHEFYQVVKDLLAWQPKVKPGGDSPAKVWFKLPPDNSDLATEFSNGDFSLNALIFSICSISHVARGHHWLMGAGYVVGHDFNADWPGVVKALSRIRRNKPITFGADFTYWWKV